MESSFENEIKTILTYFKSIGYQNGSAIIFKDIDRFLDDKINIVFSSSVLSKNALKPILKDYEETRKTLYVYDSIIYFPLYRCNMIILFINYYYHIFNYASTYHHQEIYETFIILINTKFKKFYKTIPHIQPEEMLNEIIKITIDNVYTKNDMLLWKAILRKMYQISNTMIIDSSIPSAAMKEMSV